MEVGAITENGRSVQLNVAGETKRGPENATILLLNMVVQIAEERKLKPNSVTCNSAQVIYITI